jgi:hypothetical protein
LIGFVRYDDIFANHLIVGFCLVLDYMSHSFAPVGDRRYNYTREERNGFG